MNVEGILRHESGETDVLVEILTKAREMFMKFGLKSVTMDDIAKALVMSKKTVYQYVANKKELIERVMEHMLHEESATIMGFREEATDAIEEVIKVSNHVNRVMASINPVVLYDMKKYYAQQHKHIDSIRDEFARSMILENMRRGKREGLYRNDFDEELYAMLYVGRSDMILDESMFPSDRYDRGEVHQAFVRYHLYAITTTAGRQRLQDYL